MKEEGKESQIMSQETHRNESTKIVHTGRSRNFQGTSACPMLVFWFSLDEAE